MHFRMLRCGVRHIYVYDRAGRLSGYGQDRALGLTAGDGMVGLSSSGRVLVPLCDDILVSLEMHVFGAWHLADGLWAIVNQEIGTRTVTCT